jgi:hypothetical protein
MNNRTCLECGQPILSKHAKVFCSSLCHNRALSRKNRARWLKHGHTIETSSGGHHTLNTSVCELAPILYSPNGSERS